MNHFDLNAIEHQRIFLLQAIDYYTKQLNDQQNKLNQLRFEQNNTFGWTGFSTVTSNSTQISFYEKNICFIKHILNQYQQLLESLRHMWIAYTAYQSQIQNNSFKW